MGAAWLAMGVAPVLGGAWLVAKHGFRVEGGPPRVLAAAVLAWAWVTVGMEILGNVGRLDPPGARRLVGSGAGRRGGRDAARAEA